MRVVATKTAAAWRAVKDIETYHDNPIIAMRQREVELRYRVPTDTEEVARARQILALPAKERAELHSKAGSTPTLRCDSPNRTPLARRGHHRSYSHRHCVYSMPFGDSGGDWFGDREHKKPVSAHTFLIELANGSYGYLPPPNQHELGGYETC